MDPTFDRATAATMRIEDFDEEDLRQTAAPKIGRDSIVKT